MSRSGCGLQSSPIVNLHVVYDRPVFEQPFAAGVGTPVQYLFDRSEAGGAPPGCQYLAVSLSGAQRDMERSVDALRERYLPALHNCFRVRDRRMSSASWSRASTPRRFAPGRASRALRCGPRTALRGLALAGAWTDTGWPATLEGAVLSGHAAARPPSRRSSSQAPAPAGVAVAGGR